MSNPYADPPGGSEPPGRLKAWAVVLGIVLGIIATVAWIIIVLVFAISQENSPGFPDWLAFVLFFLPLPLSVLLLCIRRTRQAAAGFVMGLAIGTIVLAGFCGSLLLPNLGA